MLIAKTFEFDAAHRLSLHSGKCKNLHGHRYKVVVQIEGEINQEPSASCGMVKDFGDFSVIKSWLDEKMDHAYISQKDDSIAAVCEKEWLKIYYMDAPTTAENIAKHLHETFQSFFPVHSIQVYETPATRALYPW